VIFGRGQERDSRRLVAFHDVGDFFTGTVIHLLEYLLLGPLSEKAVA